MTFLKNLRPQTLVLIGSALVLVFALGFMYLHVNASRVYIEKAEVSAQHVTLSSPTGGVLQEVYVNEGDIVPANTVVARVNNGLIKTTAPAQILSIHKDIGTAFGPSQEIATVIDPSELRVVAHIEEDKGLRDLKVGDSATFRVDAFGGQNFYGTVDTIAPASRSSDLVFSISDKRESKVFDVYIRYDRDANPDLKDGMSAKVWVKK